MFRDLQRALALLTILPVGNDTSARPRGKAMAWFPFVGLLIGMAVIAVFNRLLPWCGELPAAALALALWVMLTGGLHLDGWGDCCDGLLCALPRNRRLEIMKDPHAGNFAVIGLILLLLVKFTALTMVRSPAIIVLAAMASRWAAVLAARFWPVARPQGMGDTFRSGVAAADVFVATVTLLLAVVMSGIPGVVALAAALTALFLLASLAMAKLGGLTGDVYGAIIEGAETLALLAGALLWR